MTEAKVIGREAAVETYTRLGSYGAAGRELGVSKGTIYNHVKRHREAALIKGGAPDGYKVKAVTTRYDEHGDARGQSVKVVEDGGDPDRVTHIVDPKFVSKTTTLFDANRRVERQWVMEKPDLVKRDDAWRRFAEELGRRVEPAPLILAPDEVDEDTCAVYPIGDHHVGMLAWAIETRSDSYDLRISEGLLDKAAGYLMQAAPASGQAVIAFMGDFLHFDGFKPLTPQSGHVLDADSRFPKVARTAIRMVRHTIEAALRRHGKVHVIWEIGNHDPVNSILMMELLANVYANNRRVTVDTHPGHFHYYEWHRNLIGTTHGDTVKLDKLPLIMAADMPEAWGRTEHRFWLTGHVHHGSQQVFGGKDYTGASVETVPVLIPNDAYSANAGYRNRRQMQVLVLDREYGEVSRHSFNATRFHRSTLS